MPYHPRGPNATAKYTSQARRKARAPSVYCFSLGGGVFLCSGNYVQLSGYNIACQLIATNNIVTGAPGLSNSRGGAIYYAPVRVIGSWYHTGAQWRINFEDNGIGGLGYAGTIRLPGFVATPTTPSFQPWHNINPFAFAPCTTGIDSCTCPDYTQVANGRSWKGSKAGPFNPCKHIYKARILQSL